MQADYCLFAGCCNKAAGGDLGLFCSGRCFRRYRKCDRQDCKSQAAYRSRYCVPCARKAKEEGQKKQKRRRQLRKQIRLRIDHQQFVVCFCPHCRELKHVDDLHEKKPYGETALVRSGSELARFRRAHTCQAIRDAS